MLFVIGILLLIFLLGGLGFAVHLLWIIAIIALILWVAGFVFHGSAVEGAPRRRWYRW